MRLLGHEILRNLKNTTDFIKIVKKGIDKVNV